MKCEICKKEIEGAYQTNWGMYFCYDCIKKEEKIED